MNGEYNYWKENGINKMIDLMPYKLYPYFVMDWIKEHVDKEDFDSTVEDYIKQCIDEDGDFSIGGLIGYIEEFGLAGSMCYPHFEEFVDCEYQDKKYMEELTKKYFG